MAVDSFRITVDGQIMFISNEAERLLIKVEKERKLSIDDTGAIIEATLYKEISTFVPECSYVFEAMNQEEKSAKTKIDLDVFKSAVYFFFHSVLDTTYFIIRVPVLSNLSPKGLPIFENIGNINTSNLYDLLSGY